MKKSVYQVYVWKYGRLLHVAQNIVAENCREAARRAVSALRKREALQGDPVLLALMQHYYCAASFPAGVSIQVLKTVQAPDRDGLIYC